MARYGRLLTDAQWEKIRPLLPRPRSRRRGGFPRQPLAGADCATGKSKVSGSISGGRFWQNSTNGNNCSGASPSWTGVLLPPKKGHWSRTNQAGQGHEVDGGGRRPGSSFGKTPLFCIPARSTARGNDARDDLRKPPNPRGAAAAEAAAPDRRSSLRQ